MKAEAEARGEKYKKPEMKQSAEGIREAAKNIKATQAQTVKQEVDESVKRIEKLKARADDFSKEREGAIFKLADAKMQALSPALQAAKNNAMLPLTWGGFDGVENLLLVYLKRYRNVHEQLERYQAATDILSGM